MLTKQGIDISFAQGIDTKTDPKRLPTGKFLSMKNSVFNKGGQLTKRNGFAELLSLPDTTYSYLTTFNGNLTAVGPNIAAYNAPNNTWVQKGTIQPVNTGVLSVIRNNLNQSACDIAVASNGLACAAYLEVNAGTTTNKYVVFDSTTGQNITAPSVIPVSSGTVSGGMRVFVLGNNFIIVFTNTITAVAHLQYVAVSIADPTSVGTNTDIAASYISASTLSWDGYVVNDHLYLAYNTTSGGQSVKITYLTAGLTLVTAVTYATYKATMMSVTADISTPASPVIYVSFYRSDTSVGYTLALDYNLNELMSPQQIISSGTMLNITSAAQNGVVKVFYEVSNAYSFDAGLPSNYVAAKTVTLATTTVSSQIVIIRSVGLASKAFIVGGKIFFLSAFQSPYQNSYFLINGSSSTSASPVFAGKLAYENGGGYLTLGLPGVPVISETAYVGYLFKDLIQAVNKNTNVPSGSQTAGVYSQTGVNMANFTFNTDHLDSDEIGSDLHLSGGLLWMYDGYLPVEHSFMLYPDTDLGTPTDTANWSATGGSIVAKPDGATNTNAYYYQFTYEWTDNQGNAFRSAPSIPVGVTTTGSGTSGSITLNIPTLRMTMKTANPVKIVIYRWSVAQQVYYQVTSITSPTLNDTTADSVTYVDTLADASILGNNVLYTTGGVLENIPPPGFNAIALFDTRLWGIDCEDPNKLWFSKQVIEGVPVEMSDLLTIYVPPTLSTQSSLGPNRTIYPMDDKLIIGKKDALAYINGSGPDVTGANNQYSDPIFITSTVGCTNQKSIVLMPNGLMFQSDKGIWLLDRGLNTDYIGAPVEDYTLGATVTSAVNVPGTNQVRFTLDTGWVLVYDYYYGQWDTFPRIDAVSSCIYEDVHTYIDSSGAVFKENPGTYLDGSRPVNMSFRTGWIRLGDLQHYQRAYFVYLLGSFISPHKLQVLIYYDYEDNPSQSVIISPTNYSTPYGSGLSQSPYGQGDPYGGPGKLENWRVILERQRCMAVSIEVTEVFDASYGTVAGAGLTLSGLNVVCGFKRPSRPIGAGGTVG